MSDVIDDFAKSYCKDLKEWIMEYKKHPNPLINKGVYHMVKAADDNICRDIENAPEERKSVMLSRGVHQLNAEFRKTTNEQLPIKFRSFIYKEGAKNLA